MEYTNGNWTFPGESKKRMGHPAPFPKEPPYRAIKLFGYQNDMIFDPFMGSEHGLLRLAQIENLLVGY